jgi:hypothetical protein
MARMSCKIYHLKAHHTREEIAAKMRISHPEDILHTFFREDPVAHCPKFMVYVDHVLFYVVLVVRGTWDFKVRRCHFTLPSPNS